MNQELQIAGTAQVVATSKAFRPGTRVPEIELNFLFKGFGIGDYLNFTASVKWSLQEFNYTRVCLLVGRYFQEIIEVIFRDEIAAKRVRIQVLEDLTREQLSTMIVHTQMHNPNGMHLVDCGFRNYINLDAPPEVTLPCIEKQLAQIPEIALPEKYAVMTLGATVSTRKMKPETANEVIDFLLQKGITPVFLGKKEMTTRHKAEFDEGYHLHKGVNLIDQTNLAQAAKVLSGARVVLGIDGGLLHLAAMTKAPLIFGYTVASPKDRHPRRESKYVTLKVVPDEDKVPCRYCQSHMRFIAGMSAKECVYGDTLCVENLDAKKWLNALDLIFRIYPV